MLSACSFTIDTTLFRNPTSLTKGSAAVRAMCSDNSSNLRTVTSDCWKRPTDRSADLAIVVPSSNIYTAARAATRSRPRAKLTCTQVRPPRPASTHPAPPRDDRHDRCRRVGGSVILAALQVSRRYDDYVNELGETLQTLPRKGRCRAARRPFSISQQTPFSGARSRESSKQQLSCSTRPPMQL